MGDSIATSAPTPPPSAQQLQDAAQANDTQGQTYYMDVPTEIVRHFEVEIIDLIPKTRQKLRDIFTMLDGDDMASKFRSLRDVEMQLGKGNSNNNRYNRVWNWLKLNHNIKAGHNTESSKARQKAMEVT